MLTADQNRVTFGDHDFGGIHLRDFLSGLAARAPKRDATLTQYKRIGAKRRAEVPAKPDAKLKRTEMVRQIQALLTADATLIAETGDSCAQTRNPEARRRRLRT